MRYWICDYAEKSGWVSRTCCCEDESRPTFNPGYTISWREISKKVYDVIQNKYALGNNILNKRKDYIVVSKEDTQLLAYIKEKEIEFFHEKFKDGISYEIHRIWDYVFELIDAGRYNEDIEHWLLYGETYAVAYSFPAHKPVLKKIDTDERRVFFPQDEEITFNYDDLDDDIKEENEKMIKDAFQRVNIEKRTFFQKILDFFRQKFSSDDD